MKWQREVQNYTRYAAPNDHFTPRACKKPLGWMSSNSVSQEGVYEDAAYGIVESVTEGYNGAYCTKPRTEFGLMDIACASAVLGSTLSLAVDFTANARMAPQLPPYCEVST